MSDDQQTLTQPTDSTQRPTSINHFSFHGQGFDLAVLFLKNFFFLVITLGIYFPWARTNIRRFLWSNTQFNNDRFAYTGTGKELFLGWLKLSAILFAAVMMINLAQLILPSYFVVVTQILIFCAYMYLFALATYSGLRYRALRTLWRQIQFNVDRDKDQTRQFLKLYIKGALLSGLTLGLYLPFFTVNKTTFLVSKSNYGGKYFKFDGKGEDYFWICIKNFLLTVITFGIYTPWFIAKTLKYKVEHISIDQAHFKFELSGKKLFIYSIVGYFGTLFTLGLASPWIIVAFHKLFTESVTLVGNLDLSGAQNTTQNESAMGDDVAIIYDIDLGF